MSNKSKSESAQKILRNRGTFEPKPDEVNPIYLFSGVHVDLLLRCANNEFDLLKMAREELANRGLNLKGDWVGWPKGTI